MEKMEKFDLSLNETRKQTRNNSLQDASEPEKDVTESRACSDLYKDLTDLTSQVQMMSDSLAACKQMSKYRPLRKAYDDAVKTTPQTSSHTLHPAEKKTHHKTLEKDVIISYLTSHNNSLTEVEKCNICRKHDSKSECNLKGWTEHERDKGKSFGLITNSEDYRSLPKKRHKGKGKKGRGMNLEMAELIRRELKSLVYLSPSVSLLASALTDAVFKYTGCSKCSNRVSSSLPWILNRIQELILYVSIKRQENTKDNPGFESSFKEPEPKEPEADLKKSETVSVKEEKFKKIEQSGKIRASNATEARPGVQILLQVNPEKQNSRFFEKAIRLENTINYIHVQFIPTNCIPVVHVLKPAPEPVVFEERKQEIKHLKEYCIAYQLLYLSQIHTTVSHLKFATGSRIFTIRKVQETVDLMPVPPFEERSLLWNRNSLTVLTKKSKHTGRGVQGKGSSTRRTHSVEPKSRTNRRSISPEKRSNNRKPIPQTKPRPCANEKKSFNPNNFLANASDLVKELLREAETERMEIKHLEEETAILKDLMINIHKNQIILSRVLLEKGIYSESLIKLTNPNMLDGENKELKKVQESLSENGSSSLGTLKEKISALMEKCATKNKIIISLITGLQSDVPHDFWEEILNVENSKSLEEVDSEKSDELKSILCPPLVDDVKESRTKPRAEAQPSEDSGEEPNARGKTGANVKENLHYDGDNTIGTKTGTTDMEGFLDWQSQIKTLTFPTIQIPDELNTSIGELENKISQLNVENKKLWQEIHELRDLMEASELKELNEKRLTGGHETDVLMTNGKKIKLRIQVGKEKNCGSSNNAEIIKVNDLNEDKSLGGASENSPNFHSTDSASDLKQVDTISLDRKLTLLPTRSKFYLKSTNQQSQVDLNRVEEESPKIFEKENETDGQVSPGNIVDLFKPNDRYTAGPSSNRKHIKSLQQKPSLVQLSKNESFEMHAMITNERQLQPILENDLSDSSYFSEAVSQTIQKLKLKMRSLHKEVTVLKLKNDRVEKLLNRLIEEAVHDNKNLEEIKNNLKELNNRLD